MVLRLLGLQGGVGEGPTLYSERLILRPLELEDFAEWAKLRRENEAFLQPWEPLWPRDHLTYKAFRRRVLWSQRETRKLRGLTMLLCDPASEEILGGITLSSIQGHPLRSGKLGYWIGQRHARQGLMSDAVLLLSDFGFDRLGLKRVEAACLAHNTASRALLERCGFQYEGLSRAYLEVNGVTRDHLRFARIREETS